MGRSQARPGGARRRAHAPAHRRALAPGARAEECACVRVCVHVYVRVYVRVCAHACMYSEKGPRTRQRSLALCASASASARRRDAMRGSARGGRGASDVQRCVTRGGPVRARPRAPARACAHTHARTHASTSRAPKKKRRRANSRASGRGARPAEAALTPPPPLPRTRDASARARPHPLPRAVRSPSSRAHATRAARALWRAPRVHRSHRMRSDVRARAHFRRNFIYNPKACIRT